MSAVDAKDAFEALNKAFDDFKATNDQNLAKRDVVLDEKLDKINAAIDDAEKKIQDAFTKMEAAKLGGVGSGKELKDAEYSKSFEAHIRKGDIQNALSKGSSADGGYVTPVEWDRTLLEKLRLISPMRQIATVQQITGTSFTKVFNKQGAAFGWVGESDARTATTTPQLGSQTFGTGELYANAGSTQQLLDDGLIDVEAWLTSEIEGSFAQGEGAAFITGDGSNKPNGVLTYVTGAANAAANPYGAITLTNSGAASDFASTNPADKLSDMVHDLKSGYTLGATWIMNRSTIGKIRKFKDGQGNYLWQPSFVAGQPQTLMGYDLVEMPDMPDVAANAVPILFGNFARGYLVIDRAGVRVLRDPYTNKPNVMFYATKRVGGGVINGEAIKGLKIAA